MNPKGRNKATGREEKEEETGKKGVGRKPPRREEEWRKREERKLGRRGVQFHLVESWWREREEEEDLLGTFFFPPSLQKMKPPSFGICRPAVPSSFFPSLATTVAKPTRIRVAGEAYETDPPTSQQEAKKELAGLGCLFPCWERKEYRAHFPLSNLGSLE